MSTEKPVSLRKFAEMVGASDGGVRKAIKSGTIKEGVTPEGKILPSIASVEWGKPILGTEADGLADAVVITEAAELAAPNPFIAAGDAGGVGEVEDPGDSDSDAEEGDNDEVDEGEFAELGKLELSYKDLLKEIPMHTSKAEAERMIKVYGARKAKLEAMKVEEQLVDKGVVYQNLYEFAGQLRDAIMNVPARIIDNVRAAPSRNDAINLLYAELTAALTTLAQIGEVKLVKDNHQ